MEEKKKQEDEKEQEAVEENKDRVFVLTSAVGIPGYMLGVIAAQHYELWAFSGTKLFLQQPAMLMLTEVVGKQRKPVGYQTNIAPAHPIKTKQEALMINPIFVEILGNVVDDGTSIRLESAHGLEQPEQLFKQYLSFLSNWEIELSNIVKPTTDDIAAANRSRDNIIKLD